MSLFKMWEDAYVTKKLPEEWNAWDNFRAWAIANRYKAEYGYKGEFSPEGCLKAMPDYKPLEDMSGLVGDIESGKKTINDLRDEMGLDPISEGDKTLIKLQEADKTGLENDFNSLMRLKLDELKQLALEKGINIGEATTKKEIATLICGGV